MASTSDKDEAIDELKREYLAALMNHNAALQEFQAALNRYNARGSNDNVVAVREETEQPFRFLDLPRELRDRIYQLCVVVGRVMIRNPSTISSDPNAFDMRIAPTSPVETQLFCVCKKIKAEVVECYLKENMFVLLAGPATSLQRCVRWLDITRVPHAGVEYGFLRRLSVSLDHRDFGSLFVNCIIQRNDMRDAEALETTLCGHHLMQETLVQFHWFTLFEYMAECLHLECLEINLQNCYCSLGCHRLVEKAFESRGLGLPGVVDSVFQFVKDLDLKRLNILGTIDKTERDFLRAGLSGMTSTKLRFYGERSWEDGWVKWDAEKETVDDEDESMAEVGTS